MTGATFTIHRDRDISGVSGTGTVAEGWESSSGEWVIVLWLSATPSLEIHSDIRHVEAIHGHGGATRIVWDTPKQYTPTAPTNGRSAWEQHDDPEMTR
jgi:hypothetical protein